MTTSEKKISSREISILEDQAVSGKPKCLILARAGSKRLKNKNKLLLGGKPLVVRAIETAKQSEIFEAIMVSSDDEDILEMAYDAKVQPHKRGKELAGDNVQMKHVVRYLLSQFEFGKCACLLTPCNPFVTSEDLKAGYELFKEKEANYVMSVKVANPPPALARRVINGFIESAEGLQRAQKYESLYFADGGFIFFAPEAFINEFDDGFYGTKCVPYITPHIGVDIDSQQDFDYAQYLLEGK